MELWSAKGPNPKKSTNPTPPPKSPYWKTNISNIFNGQYWGMEQKLGPNPCRRKGRSTLYQSALPPLFMERKCCLHDLRSLWKGKWNSWKDIVATKWNIVFIETTGLKLEVVTIEVDNTCQNSLSVLLCWLVNMVVIGMCLTIESFLFGLQMLNRISLRTCFKHDEALCIH